MSEDIDTLTLPATEISSLLRHSRLNEGKLDLIAQILEDPELTDKAKCTLAYLAVRLLDGRVEQ